MTKWMKTDSKGRLTLGESYKNCVLTMEEREHEVVLHRARIIPERESWLYDNSEARDSVRRGLNQAAAGELSDGPDLDEAAELANGIEDDE